MSGNYIPPTTAVDSKTITETTHLPHPSSLLDLPLPLTVLISGGADILPIGRTYFQGA